MLAIGHLYKMELGIYVFEEALTLVRTALIDIGSHIVSQFGEHCNLLNLAVFGGSMPSGVVW